MVDGTTPILRDYKFLNLTNNMDNNNQNTPFQNENVEYISLEEKLKELWEKEEQFLKSVGVDPYGK